ncbi:heme o synthase [Salinibacillus aidingensis]|uniref:Protoheme IX farnesyltransferase n=1 Tax=Salinibacillus aidingensis TaxID=237684 RepID=A0ABP3LGF2_9BACI
MAKEVTFSVNQVEDEQVKPSLLADLRELFKAGVLMANVLPVFTGFWLAIRLTGLSFSDHLSLLLLTIIGSTCVMAGALIINNWYDVDIDTVMRRTQKRPTVTGHMSLKTVLWLGILLSVTGMILLWFTSAEAAFWAFVGWFTYVWLYTMWSKRRYTLNTLIGSVSGAVTPLIGWAAVSSTFHFIPIVLFLVMFIWQVPHTFAVAIRKHDEYKAAGVAMLPVVHGIDITKRQTTVYIACLFPLPFLLAELGVAFVLLATLLNIGWFIFAVRGFFMEDHLKWARMIFLYSLNYLVIFYVAMIIVTAVF